MSPFQNSHHKRELLELATLKVAPWLTPGGQNFISSPFSTPLRQRFLSVSKANR